jgi:hypothetical protein
MDATNTTAEIETTKARSCQRGAIFSGGLDVNPKNPVLKYLAFSPYRIPSAPRTTPIMDPGWFGINSFMTASRSNCNTSGHGIRISSQ